MDETTELKDFAVDLQQQVAAQSEAEEDGALRPETFAEVAFGYLAEIGEIDDAFVRSFEARGARCSGYFLSEDNDRLDLFLVVPHLDGEVASISKSDLDTAFKRLLSFFERAVEGLHTSLEEANPGFEVARAIWLAKDELSHVRLFVVTDRLASVEKIEPSAWRDVRITSHVWDLRRLYRASSSGSAHEPISIDFTQMRTGPVPCLVAAPEGGGYRCLLAMFPGDLLVELYKRFGPRLLERNVRSFLQLKGKVNQSIRRTILDEPQMFLAFNNGLSVTASGLVLRDGPSGTAHLVSAQDFQIVNGGQTTGSIFRASRKDRVDASRLSVAVKITEILSDGDIDTVAPRISESANNQNKVNMADFTSNNPFHRKLEELSRTIWAPPSPGMQRQTRWFFERARGQYHDALAKERTPAQRRAFELTHPRRQLITKTDLAKVEHTWSQLPHVVSRGAQKCYLDFMDVLRDRGNFVPDEGYFQHVVARTILFREAEKIVSKQNFGGYRANIVTYTLAWISHRTAKRVDLDSIWNRQSLPDPLRLLVETVCIAAHRHITTPPGGQNVTEWCKKETCWVSFKEFDMPLPASVEGLLVTRPAGGAVRRHGVDEHLSATEAALIQTIAGVAPETWFALAAWAKDTQTLLPWQRSLAFSLGRIAGSGRDPSRKQAVQGEKILEEAMKLGFRSQVSDQ